MAKTRNRRLDWMFTLTAACNLVGLPKFLTEAPT